MSWTRRKGMQRANCHKCTPPTKVVHLKLCDHSAEYVAPDGVIGDTWRCDACFRLWVIKVDAETEEPIWRPAGIFRRIWYFDRGYSTSFNIVSQPSKKREHKNGY